MQALRPKVRQKQVMLNASAFVGLLTKKENHFKVEGGLPADAQFVEVKGINGAKMIVLVESSEYPEVDLTKGERPPLQEESITVIDLPCEHEKREEPQETREEEK